MRKILIIALLCMGLAGTGIAQTAVPDKDERDLEALSKKLIRMKREMDSFMGELASSYAGQTKGFAGFGSDVRVDIVENAKDFVVRADIPGMDKDKITVTLERGKILKISGAREMTVDEAGPNIVRHERMEGKFERVIELPAECRSDGISGSYNNGVLEIKIPKKEEARPEMVKVSIK